MASEQTSVPVLPDTLQQMDETYKLATRGTWTIREYQNGEAATPYIEINDGSEASGNQFPEIITYSRKSRRTAADFNFLALAHRSYPTISAVLSAMLKNELHPSYSEAKNLVAELDQYFGRTSKGSWGITLKGMFTPEAYVTTPTDKVVFTMCAGEVGDLTWSLRDAQFAIDIQAFFPGIKMAFQEFSLKQKNPGSVLESYSSH